ncbi:hypothetical protein LR48_Vigan11g039400 [Vigna angularis]|uniref:Uncharacterized protein n=1 Tax=Phaseolus angularis TaxID=3914 RepID=A0A0L9VQK7_PHAAN|nr:hypothetical protein LR48_Vigan11g039400 [Vigna angularis]
MAKKEKAVREIMEEEEELQVHDLVENRKKINSSRNPIRGNSMSVHLPVMADVAFPNSFQVTDDDLVTPEAVEEKAIHLLTSF